MVLGQLKAITPERVKNTEGTESFCGLIMPKGSVVDYVRAAYSQTNTAELEFCWGDAKIYEGTTYLTQAYLTEEACTLAG